MRVSDRMRYNLVQDRVEDAKGANANSLDRLSSQKDILKLSDDPIGAARVIRYRDRIGNMIQFQKNIDYSKGLLERSETAISGIADNLIRAKELAIGMANDTYDAKSREATSREIREIIDEVVQLANSTFNGKFIFGGFRNQTPPLNLQGDYLGDDGALYLQISPDNFRQVNLQARDLFEASHDERTEGHLDMVPTLEVLYQGLIANDKDSIHNAMNELEHQLDKTTSFQATVGGMWTSLNDAYQRISKEEESNRIQLSNIEDTDVYSASSDFKRTEVTLQSTLLASTKLLQPSLLNFLQ